MQLLEVYPELTSHLKKVIDVQYLEVSDWIAQEFDNYQSHLMNNCLSKATARKYIDEQLNKCEVRSQRDSLMNSAKFFFKKKVMGIDSNSGPAVQYDTF